MILPDSTGSVSIGLHGIDPPGEPFKWEVRGDHKQLEAINRIVFEVALRAGRPLLWSTLQLHRSVSSVPHKDAGIEEALLVVTGVFEGGELHVGEAIPLKDQAVYFCPSALHHVQAHTGDRLSLVAHLHPGWHDGTPAPRALRDQLRVLGFRPGQDSLPVVVPPVRVVVAPQYVNKKDFVYVGRGHPKFGLARSKWGNPYAITKALDRKAPLRKFRRHMGEAKHLTASLEELGGKTLGCHCPLDLDCHADVLIELFKERFSVDSVPPPSDNAIEGEAASRRKAVEGANGKKKLHPIVPSVYVGTGEPLRLQRRSIERLVVEGGASALRACGHRAVGPRHRRSPRRSGASSSSRSASTT